MNVTLVLVIVLGGVVVAGWDIFCLHDLARADRVRYLPKWVWAFVCLISWPWGGILYVIFGREGFGRDL
jgi:hypothetical protein